MASNKTVVNILKSYGIAFVICLFFTALNAISDYKDPFRNDTLSYIIRFHFLSALGYAVPVSALVYFVIRNPSQQVRMQKALRVITYLVLIIIGGFVGSFVVSRVIFDFDEPAAGELDGMIPWLLGIIIGAILLPLVYFLYNRRRKN